MSDGTCRYCGHEVVWRESRRTGKKYLAVRAEIRGETGRVIKTIYPAHVCKVSDPAERRAIDERRDADKIAAIERGEIVIGQTVVVHKGRKYPIGTTGVIEWIAREADGYGVIKVRIVTEAGDRLYVNQANIKPAIKEEAK